MTMARSKTVELQGRKFQLRRLPTELGSFIFMRMLGVSMRAAAATLETQRPDTSREAPATDAPPSPPPTGEEQVRALSFSVFSGGMPFEDFKFIQTGCMKVVSIIEERSEQEFPMPVMLDNGAWTPSGEDLSYDVGLVMRLTTEVLILCFADFFGGGGLGL